MKKYWKISGHVFTYDEEKILRVLTSEEIQALKEQDISEQNISVTNLIEGTTNPVPYIAIDGSDGIGKSTFILALVEHLRTLGFDVLHIKEPGQTAGGKLIRQLVLQQELMSDEQLELFMADRLLTQELVIKPALEKGQVVVSDRSVASTLVYQGYMKDQVDKVLKLHWEIENFVWPSITFIGQLDFKETIRRLNQRRAQEGEFNIFDQKKLDYHLEVREYFNHIHEVLPSQVEYLDFSLPTEELIQKVIHSLNVLKDVKEYKSNQEIYQDWKVHQHIFTHPAWNFFKDVKPDGTVEEFPSWFESRYGHKF